jgi:hypothetical protein
MAPLVGRGESVPRKNQAPACKREECEGENGGELCLAHGTPAVITGPGRDVVAMAMGVEPPG